MRGCEPLQLGDHRGSNQGHLCKFPRGSTLGPHRAPVLVILFPENLKEDLGGNLR